MIKGLDFRLFQIISPGQSVDIPEAVASDMLRFIDAISEEPDLPLKDFGLAGLSIPEVVKVLRGVYGLPEQGTAWG
jgi:hypothetical protein